MCKAENPLGEKPVKWKISRGENKSGRKHVKGNPIKGIPAKGKTSER